MFPNHNPPRSTSNCGRHRCASRATPIPPWCACCWSACGHDRMASEDADLDCGGRDRLAPRLHRAECVGADEVGAESVLRTRVCVSRAARLIKVLWYDGDGLCLFAKRLERGRFVWPQATSGTVSLTRAQLSMLLEGIDWRRPERTWDPQLSV